MVSLRCDQAQIQMGIMAQLVQNFYRLGQRVILLSYNSPRLAYCIRNVWRKCESIENPKSTVNLHGFLGFFVNEGERIIESILMAALLPLVSYQGNKRAQAVPLLVFFIFFA
jgi:hypothetical protein